jgi:O-antigen ligase
MTFSYQQILILPIAISLGWLQFRNQKKKSIFWFIAAGLIAAGVTFSFSRGAWLGMVISLIVIAYFMNKIVGRVVLASILVFTALVFALAPTSLFATRAQAFFKPHEVISTQERFYMWQSALAIAVDNPLCGAGWGNFTPAHADYKMPGDIWAPSCNAHSNYFTALADTGWVGLGIFLLLTIESMMITWRIARTRNRTDICKVGYGLFGSMIAISIASVSQTSLVDAEVAMLFFLLLGIINNVKHLKKSQIPIDQFPPKAGQHMTEIS